MYTLKLKPEVVSFIGEAVGNMPFKQAAPVMAELQRQITEQDEAAKAAARPADSPPAND